MINREELRLLRLAEERMKNCDPTKTLSYEQVLKRYGITEEEIDALIDEVEIE